MSPACNCSAWISYQIFSRAVTEQATQVFFLVKQLQKDQNGNGSFGCQDRPVLRSSANPSQYVGTVKDCKVPKQKNAILYHNRWPQKNSAEVMKDRQSINLILRTLLDPRLLLLDCDCELLPSCTKISPQTSLPKISVHSASRKSHRARSSTNFNYSSTLRLKIVKQKKR